MKDQITKVIKDSIKSNFNLDEEVVLVQPPEKELGDFATNIAFIVAKKAGQKPDVVAKAIMGDLGSSGLCKRVEIANFAYINVFVDTDAFANSAVAEILRAGEAYSSLDIGAGKVMSIEHTAANPNKHLHVGHLRNFSIGDALVRLMRKAGYEVRAEYFLNDQGLQVAKVVWGFMNYKKLGLKSEVEVLVDEAVSKVEQDNSSVVQLEQKLDTTAATVYVESEKYLAQHPESEVEVQKLIENMEAGNNPEAIFAEKMTKAILVAQLETTSKFGVEFDLILPETVMTQSGEVQRIIDELYKKGSVRKISEGDKAGCYVISGLVDAAGKEIAPKILTRQDGTALYTAKDIVLHLWKYGLMGVDFRFNLLGNNNVTKIARGSGIDLSLEPQADVVRHINVVDQRQWFPLEVVKQSLKNLGFEPQSASLQHLGYETVVLSTNTAISLGFVDGTVDTKVVAMSGRKGIEIPIDELLARMSEQILVKGKEKYEDFTYSEAEIICCGALKYYMLRFDFNTIIVFDIDEATKADGDSGIYLIYSMVRANSILEKFSDLDQQLGDMSADVNFTANDIPTEAQDLIVKLTEVKDVLKPTVDDLKLLRVAEYAYDLARNFTRFYSAVSIQTELDPNKRLFFYALVKAYSTVFSEVLAVIGIEKIERI